MNLAPQSNSLEISLLGKTPSNWLSVVLNNFDHFLIDHAACERKASAVGVQFVVKYPDRPQLIDPLLQMAREELLHFHQVMGIIKSRGLQLVPDTKDPYINGLLAQSRNGRDEHFIDRLLIFGIAEARGTERFGLVAENLNDEKLKKFYRNLTEAEARHHQLFIDLSLEFFPEDMVRQRLNELLLVEKQVVESIPIRPTVH